MMNTARSYVGLQRALRALVFLVLASSLAGGCASSGPKPPASPTPMVTPVAQVCSATVREYPLPDPTLLPTALTTGPDGQLWVIEAGTMATQANPQDSFLARLTPPTFQQFPVPFHLAGLNALTAGPDGNLWYTRYGTVGSTSSPCLIKRAM